jgi:hypothetical protein
MNPPQHFVLRLAFFFASPPAGAGDPSTDTAPYVTAEEFICPYGIDAELIPQRYSAISPSASFCGPLVSLVDIHQRLLNALGSSFDDTLILGGQLGASHRAQLALCQLRTEIENDFAGSDLFVIKDPGATSAAVIDAFGDLLIDLVVVISVRSPIELAASLKKGTSSR